MGLTHLDAPSGWWLGKIQDVAVLKSGSTPLRAEHERYFSGGTIPWVKTMDLTNGKVFSTDEMITETALAETSCPVLDAGTVLVAMYGGFNQIGRTGLMTFKGSINQAMSALVVKPDKAIPEYVLHWLNANIDTWRHFAASSRKDPNITQNDVASFPILIPPLPEQRRIAEILGAWDDAIALTGRLIDALKRRKQGLMQRLLTGQVRFPQFGSSTVENGELPANWHEARFNNVFERIDRLVTDNSEHVLSITATVGFQDQREKFSRVIAGKNLERYVRLFKGEFAYNKGNSDAYPQGCVYRLEEFEEGAVPNVYYCFRADSPEILSDFYKYYFEAGMLNEKLRPLINTGVRNDGLLNLSAERFFNIQIEVPPIDEQWQISELLDLISSEIKLLIEKEEALQQQKHGLMQRLLTGQIRVGV